MPVHACDPDNAVFVGLGVDRPLTPICVAEDRGHRRIPWKREIRERPVIPDARWRELGARAGPIIVIGGLCRDGARGAAIVFRVAKLHHVEGRAADFLDVEVIAAPVRVDGHIGMDAARDGFDREGLAARNTVDLKAFRVTRDDRADALALAKLDGGHMGEGDIEAVDLAVLVGGQPHPAVIGPAARDCFGEGEPGQQGKKADNNQLTDQINSPICRSGWNIPAR